ncbi:hypothetical protein [Salinimicrobium terrae]|uniref:hypothetical protein n=1 Tax=Salinimicrobium terrae TaxID=470866 RepID=UPI0004185F3F|nr:hypothetical protein [Salinimicrobium terrae]
MRELEIKHQLLEACTEYVTTRINKMELGIKDLEAALKLETKCSMGDKYETDRAMLHLEFEKIAGQSEGFKKLQKTVRAIPSGRIDEKVTFGSVVKTPVANYFISIPAGELIVNGEKYFAVGASAPISKVLTGKTAGDVVNFNGREIMIQKVF